ncbi:phage head-tail connector protein [Mesorhizobium sp. B2-3-5]|uniref:head-tail connector protein n=1 Tax=Mesorhizobium sp. B2-3-5 TaxID=2589958 RepID=UPI001129C028|nr:phage head-tail connector protein [Mesorhizobium sp. B2-3-5]TPM36632.1 hypothetical protein FJ958_02065 [Mesorhizobium sp. B2-3-5]
MALKLIAAPEDDPVTLAEAKAHLNVFGDDDDALIQRLIAAAAASLDGPYGDLGRCLVSQTWQMTLDAFPRGAIVMPLPPTISVLSLTYINSAGVEIVEQLDGTGDSPPVVSEVFRVSGLGTERATITAVTAWPSTSMRPEAITVTFKAGFAEFGDDLPQDLRNLVLARVGAAYAVRESTIIGIQQGANSETDAALDRYRMRGF